MLIYAVLLFIGSINATDTSIRDGIYSQSEFGIKVQVINGEPITAKLFEQTITLTKSEDKFIGTITNNEQTTGISISKKDKKRLNSEVIQRLELDAAQPDTKYEFTDLGIIIILKDNLISTLYTGLNNRPNINEIVLDEKGNITSYKAQGSAPYTIDVKNGKIRHFWCSGCSYQITGQHNNRLEVSDRSFSVFQPNTIEIYNPSGVKKAINTNGGNFISIDTNFYNNKAITNSSIQFKVEGNKLLFLTISNITLKKSL